MKRVLPLLAMGATIFAIQTTNANVQATQPKQINTMEQALKHLNFNNVAITPSAIAGVNQIISDFGVHYISDNGDYLISGNIYDISAVNADNKTIKNITTFAMNTVRQKILNSMTHKPITFKAENEKYQVMVFTDTSCGYCRQLHAQIAEYNQLGITIQYYAFPRNGEDSDTFTQMQAVWCAVDPKDAMTNAKSGDTKTPKAAESCDETISEHYATGKKLGISGTPAMLVASGELIPGYQSPADLLKSLKNMT